MRELCQDDNSEEDSTALREEQKILVIEILTLEAARNIFSKQIAGLTADISKASAKLEMFTKDQLEKSQCTHKLIEYFRVTGQTDLTILAANSKARTFAKLWIRPTSCSAVMALVVK